MLGRKLTLKEKITLLILKKKLKKQADESKQGQTAFVLGIISIALLIAGLFLPYVILGALIAAIIAIVMGNMAKKKDPSDMKAKMGALMGWITLGGIALILILVAAIIASWSWGW
jgi:predicted membrane protein